MKTEVFNNPLHIKVTFQDGHTWKFLVTEHRGLKAIYLRYAGEME